MKSLPQNIDAMLKSLICDKTKIPHMNKTVYDPSCLRYCSDLCGIRCKDLCNLEHTGCSRGVLPEWLTQCPSSSPNDLRLDFITYESKEVETFGKGKPFKRVEKVATNYDFKKFMDAMRSEFLVYGEHTLSYWYLRATKLEAFSPSASRSNTATITADFGEAIQIVGKYETSDQFYHRPEVNQNFFLCFNCLLFSRLPYLELWLRSLFTAMTTPSKITECLTFSLPITSV